MRIGVTGASGFIGRGIISRLLNENYSIVSFVRNKSFNCKHKLNQIVYVKDITFNTSLYEKLKGVDVLIHTAAKVHVMKKSSLDTFQTYSDVNTYATIKLAKEASLAGVKKIIFLSSIKVNGEETKKGHPFTEDNLPEPKDFYGISKYEAEMGLLKVGNQTGIDIVILRLPLVYGINVKGNFLRIIKLINKGIPLPFGSIQNNRRSYLSLNNLTDLVVKIINSKKKIQDVYLVSDEDDVSTSILLAKVAKAMDKKIYMIPLPQSILSLIFIILNKKKYSSKLFGNLQVDINKVKKTFDWKPLLNLDEGLKKLLLKSFN